MVRLDLRNVPTSYINISEDWDKRVQAEYLLREFKDVSRVNAIKLDNKILALSMSQEKALLANTSVPCLVLEDDCTEYDMQFEIDIPDDADIVFLGIWDMDEFVFKTGSPIPPYEKLDDNWHRVYNMLGSHAILYVSEIGRSVALKAYDLAIKTEFWNDVVLGRALPFINAYALKKPIFYQTSMIKSSKIEYPDVFTTSKIHDPLVRTPGDL
jgi:hypothetical protein